MSWTFDEAAYRRRTAWFQAARFGLFLHWGLYAIPARGEWVRNNEYIPKEAYDPLLREFNPTACDMRAWARMARDAGMQYAVLTAKHHDGFCLFDSALTDYKSTNSPAGRDFVREFLDACREVGLRTGLYYSLIDWHHPDYPHQGDRTHPMCGNPDYPDEGRDFNRYLEYLHGQVRELCTHYGRLDILWFDFSHDHLRGPAWRGEALMQMVRSLQPDVVTNNRLEVSGEGFGSMATGHPTPYHGDFITPEQFVPPRGLQDANGKPLVWEACITMNNHWGYCARDNFYKPAPLLVRKLVECVSKGGNMLLNVGPDAKGRFPVQSQAILAEIGRWMEKNQDSILGCGPSPYPKPEYGRYTQKGDKLYVHILENTLGPVPLTGIPAGDIQHIRLLQDGSEVPLSRSWVHADWPDLAFADLGENPVLPDPVDTVLEVTLREPPAPDNPHSEPTK